MKSFLKAIYIMKRLRRQGWIRAGVPISNVESIAEHSFGTALIALLLATVHNSQVEEEEQVDVFRVTIMALLHDFPESGYLDIDKSFDELLGPRASKLKEELDAKVIEQLLEGIPADQETLKALLNPPSSFEKTLVKYADKLELLGQTMDYSASGVPDSTLQDFLSSCYDMFSTTDIESVKKVYQALID